MTEDDDTRPTGADQDVAPDPLVIVLRSARGAGATSWPKNKNAPKRPYVPLSEALTTEYRYDAHTTGYSVPSMPRRLSEGAPAKLDAGVTMVLAIFDFDDPEKGNNDGRARDGWREEQLPRFRSMLDAHRGGFLAWTRGGFRVFYVLAEPFVIRSADDADEWKRRYAGWIAYIDRRFALFADHKCMEWQHLQRLPHATRDGELQQLPMIGDAGNVGAWSYKPTAEDIAHARTVKGWAPVVDKLEPRTAKKKTKRPATERTPVTLADDKLTPLREVLALLPARHGAYLPLAGALVERGVANVADVMASLAPTKESAEDARAAGETTIARQACDKAIKAYGTLEREYPEIADALDDVIPPDETLTVQRVRDQLAAAPVRNELPADDAAGVTREASLNPPAVVTIHHVDAGVGKTHERREIMPILVARGESVAYVGNTRHLAREQRRYLLQAGHDSTLVRGNVEAQDDKGNHQCADRDYARRMQKEGWNFSGHCWARHGAPPTCEFALNCFARLPLGNGEIGLTTHAKSSDFEKRDHLAFDEMPTLAEAHEPRPRSDIARAIRYLHEHHYRFDPRWLESACETLLAFAEVADDPAHVIPENYPSDCDRSPAFVAGPDVEALALLCPVLTAAVDPEGVTWTEHAFAATTLTDATGVIVERARRGKPTHILSATPDIEAVTALLARHGLAAPAVVKAHARDGAPVRRVAIAYADCSQKKLTPKDDNDVRRVDWSIVLPQLRNALDVIDHDERARVLIVTTQPIADALRGTDSESAKEDDYRYHHAENEEAHALLAGRDVCVVHYQATLGIDAWKGCDGAILLGAPLSQPDDAARVARRVGRVVDSEADAWTESRRIAVTLLDQAIGRLRIPRRTDPCTLVVVGSLMPSTFATANTEVVKPKRGAPAQQDVGAGAWVGEHLAGLGSLRAAADMTGLGKNTIARIVNGKQQPTCDQAWRTRIEHVVALHRAGRMNEDHWLVQLRDRLAAEA